MAIQGNRSDGPLSEINVTPLVDVMLVLLIIFMVTAPMLQEGVEVNLPQVKAQNITAEKSLVVALTKDKRIYLNERRVTLEELEERLRSFAAADPKKEVYLRADKDVPYGVVVDVMARIKKAGITQLGMVTQPLAS